MAWTIDGNRIYVEKDTGWQSERRQAEIDVLDSSKTIIHDSGRPSYKRSIQFVVFSGYAANILPLQDAASSYTLVSDQGSEGSVFVKSLEPERLQAINYDTPVYRVTMEMTKDDS